MILSLVLVSVLVASPAREFADHFPGSSTISTTDGQRLIHASQFVFDSGARRGEDAASTFLDLYGAAFGVTPRQSLVLRGAPAPGTVSAVSFERVIDGFPVFGGDVVVGIDTLNRVFLVNSSDVPPLVSGQHSVDEGTARLVAVLSSLDGPGVAGPAAVARGWLALGTVVRGVYRVDFVGLQPTGDWRVFVDGESGKVLFRENLRQSVSSQGGAFEVSPVETAAGLCPMSGTGHSFCASPVVMTFQNLATGTDLTGSQTTVYNCYGADAPTTRVNGSGACSPVLAAGGAFIFGVDPSYRFAGDNFAAAMAYFHLDKHASFLRGLDPTLPPITQPGASTRALRASLPALVNVYQGGVPFENAFFSPLLDAMVFGQGVNADYAYDAPVSYHEFTHGAVWAWGGFNTGVDSLGALVEAKAVNEGTADAMAASENGRSEIGSFVGATQVPATAYLRDLRDPNAIRSCQGNGTLVTQLGVSNVVNGLDGEEHDDGEIWNGFYWEVFRGLAAAGIRGCGGLCEVGPMLQYKTLQLAGGTSPTFNSYWQTMRAAAIAMYPSKSGVATYVDCVARRRRLNRCDRTVPIYSGESKVQYLRALSSFQMVLPATGATQFQICSRSGATTTTVHARLGLPVEFNPVTGAFTDDGSVSPIQVCAAGSTTISLSPGGNWYVLLYSTGSDAYRIDASLTGMAVRPAPVAPATCIPPFLVVAPASAIVPPGGSLVFGASGGSGLGYTWSLLTNASQGFITATGAYSAGPTASVSDVVQVRDSLGNTATRNVTVTGGVAIAPATPSAPPRGTITFSASGGSGDGFTWTLPTSGSGGTITAAGAYTAGPVGGVSDVVRVADSLGNTASVSVAVATGVLIAPAAPSTAPRGILSFTASGGSGAGFTWSLLTGASGGSITAGGGYTAGAIGGVTDAVQVTDSIGNRATRSISVTAGLSISPAAASTSPKGNVGFTAAGGSGVGLTWSLANNASGATISSAGSYSAGSTGGVVDVVRVMDSLGNSATSSISVGGGIALSPASPSTPPRGGLTFSAAGGSGGGFSWSIPTNASGGSITAAGIYTAGANGGVTDIVQATDSLGSTATRSVTVTAGASILPGMAYVPAKGTVAFSATGGSGAGFAWSLDTNASGGTMTEAGMYTAGSVSGGMDVVQVTDSLGNVATANVSVAQAGCGCGTSDGAPSLTLCLAALLRRRRARPQHTS